ncbi:MADS-box transcription factor 22-like isoform X2 [Wolffia australiana]
MAREKIKLRKIENAAARQVTFSKRRQGLFKKAQELAILCDVDVGVIVFSSTGKLYEFSSQSMSTIIEKYQMYSNPSVQPDQTLKKSMSKSIIQDNDITEATRLLRYLKRKNIGELTLEDLELIENTLENGLCRVLEKKGEKFMEEIRDLQLKGEKLTAENALLRQQVMEITKGKENVALPDPIVVSQDEWQSCWSTSSTLNFGEYDDNFDTSLKLGLPFYENGENWHSCAL